MRTISNGNDSILIPNIFFCTKSRYAYVKCTLESAVRNQDVTLEVYEVNHQDAGVSVARKTNSQGVAVFPIGNIAESLVKEFGEGIVIMFNAVYAGGGVGGSSHPIVGYADYEIEALNAEAKDDPNATNYPAAEKIVIYPYTGLTQTVFVPASLDVELTTDEDGGRLVGRGKGPFISFEAAELADEAALATPGLRATITLSSGKKSISIPADYDMCDKGVFLKWIDKSGIPYVYRWTLEKSADEMSVESTYMQLDETLQPVEVQNKTVTKRYTLHSRIVEREIYEMCKTIIGCQELWMHDAKLSDWVRCSIEEAEAEDSGSPMRDLVVEVIKREYNL